MASRNPWFFAVAGLSAGLLVAVGVWIGKTPAPGSDAESRVSQLLLQAGTGASNEVFSVCTSPLEDGEALFMLDGITGDLTCLAIHPRVGKFRARFVVNVLPALGGDPQKKPKYLMAAGMMSFPRGAGGNRLAQGVVYVVDANSGNFAAYGVPWNQNLWSNGGPIAANLVLIDSGTVRNVAIAP
jgi:hypothetical protein